MKIFVAGHKGLVGSALVRALERRGDTILLADRLQVDLRHRAGVQRLFDTHHPEQVYLAAARVGGIMDHVNNPVPYLLDNLDIQNNVITASYSYGVKKLLFLGSACIYPKHAQVPIHESALMTGPLEPSNEGYAIAKIAGIKLCQAYRRQLGCDFISVMPTNLYGINDTYDTGRSHVLPAMIKRFSEAKRNGLKEVVCWGTGNPTREFLYAGDLARACIFLMDKYSSEDLINVGSGESVSLARLASLVSDAVGYEGSIRWDCTHPDGTPNRLLDCTRLSNLGWKPLITLRDGISLAVADYRKRYE